MKVFIFIGQEKIGEADFAVTDESMGAVGGNFLPCENYKKYQETIQKQFDENGLSNSNDFEFRIILQDGSELKPDGGIGITDSKESEEIYVESAGNNLEHFVI